MAAMGTPNEVSAEFLKNFEAASSPGGKNVRFFQVTINSQEIVNQSFASGPCGSSVQSDFDEMKARAGEAEPCFFLFRLSAANPKEWLFIAWVPDRAPVDKKMLYSSAKGRIKDKLGFSKFVADEHCSVLSELTWESFAQKHETTDDRSEFEKQHDKILAEEKSEAEERAEAGAKAGGAVSSVSSHAAGGIGGYHSVSIPLSDEAKAAVRRLDAGEVNLLELQINDAKAAVNCPNAQSVPNNAAMREAINFEDARFYAYAIPRPVPGGAKDILFIYCCPDKAPQKNRMVYSTSKNAVADAMVDVCPNLKVAAKKLEVGDATELDDQSIREAVQVRGGVSVIQPKIAGFGGYAGGRAGAMDHGGTVNTSQNVTRAGGSAGASAQHPIYGLMAGNSSASGRKKIVIPPKGAW